MKNINLQDTTPEKNIQDSEINEKTTTKNKQANNSLVESKDGSSDCSQDSPFDNEETMNNLKKMLTKVQNQRMLNW